MDSSDTKDRRKQGACLRSNGWIISEHEILFLDSRHQGSDRDKCLSTTPGTACPITYNIPGNPAAAHLVRKAAAALAGMLRHEQVFIALTRQGGLKP